VTPLLHGVSKGDHDALERLTPVVYEQLKRLAAHFMNAERSDHTLQTTALVHEAYFLLVRQKVDWRNKAHFFAVAAKLMRRILVDHARGHTRGKRGGKQERISLDEAIVTSPNNIEQVLGIDEALANLEIRDAQQARIVELRFFAGLSTKETAEVLGISSRTVEREWLVARAWLRMQLSQRYGHTD
jgi:RNA polymerase sigma-70 factor, ECF subfamily